MTNSEADIVRASETDLDGIVALQAANQPEHGGTLSANLPHSRIAAMMREMPLIVARRGNLITGYLMTSSRAMNADVPIISAMLAAYPGTADAYVYGPICVSAEEAARGWRKRCSRSCGAWNQHARAYSLSGVITQPLCALMQKWG